MEVAFTPIRWKLGWFVLNDPDGSWMFLVDQRLQEAMKQHRDLADAQITTNEIVMTALKQAK